MRIAHCLEYPIQQHGGTEVLVRELLHGLSTHHDLVLVSNDSPESLARSEVASCVKHHLRWDPEGATLQQSKNLAQALADQKVDLAHFHFGGTFAWGSRKPGFAPSIHLRRRGVACLATNHGVFGPLDGYVGPQRSLITKLALFLPALISRLQLIAHLEMEVAVSKNDYRSLCRRYWPARRKFRQVYHSRIHESEPIHVMDRTKTILCAGTLGLRKGQSFLARAFAHIASTHRDWNLVLVGRPGDEPTVGEVRQLMARPELQGRMTWIQDCSDAELRRWFQSVEIFAMPSLHEGLGLSLQEALYYGCACIASRIGGIPDLIEAEENGILVERANVEELAAGLSRLIRDDAFRARIRSRARESILEKDMTAERMVGRYEKLYAEVMAR